LWLLVIDQCSGSTIKGGSSAQQPTRLVAPWVKPRPFQRFRPWLHNTYAGCHQLSAHSSQHAGRRRWRTRRPGANWTYMIERAKGEGGSPWVRVARLFDGVLSCRIAGKTRMYG
jgi:hypothetical protein